MARLLDPNQLVVAKERDFFYRRLLELGEAAADARLLDSAHLAVCAGAIPPGLKPIWLALASRELLLAVSSGNRVEGLLKVLGRETRPFGEAGPTLGDLLGTRVAAVLVPLKLPGSSGAPAQLWLVRGARESWRDDREWLDPDRKFGLLEDDKRLYWIDASGRPTVDGPSWQLGAAVAKLALDRDDDGNSARRLAKEWVVTGRMVDADRVGYVDLGNKHDLAEATAGRHWLLPMDNAKDVQSRPDFELAARGRIRYAGTLREAESSVFSDERSIREKGETWPSNVSVLHLFTTPALGALVASAMWCRPKRVVLWTTPHTRTLEAPLLEALKALGLSTDIPREIDDERVDQAEEALLSDDSLRMRRGDETVLFNVTGGNLLMRLASAHNARLAPHVHLVYRSEKHAGTENLEFTRLRYIGFRAHTAALKAPMGINKRAASDLLNVHCPELVGKKRRNHEMPKTAKEATCQLLEHMRRIRQS